MSRSIEYTHYDRAGVGGTRPPRRGAASYRAYLRFVSAWNRHVAKQVPTNVALPAQKPAIEPYFLKKADLFIRANLHSLITLDDIAAECCTSARNLQIYFRKFRGVTPIAHVRNLRLDAVAEAIRATETPIAALAEYHGFLSATTFASEYKRRFGVTPRKAREDARRRLRVEFKLIAIRAPAGICQTS